MTSNGYLFDAETVQRAKELWQLKNVQITLDGREKTYNLVKRYIYDNVNAFERVLKNIELLTAAGIHVAIRLNVDKHNIEEMLLLLPLLHERFGDNKYLSVYSHELFGERSPEDNAALYEQRMQLEQLIAETPRPLADDELIDDFLFNFASNRKLQMERVLFPLLTVKGNDTTRVDMNRWKMERFFMRQDFYTVLFDNERQMELVRDTSVSEAKVEKIYFNTGAVVQYMFRRIKGAWLLIEQKTEPIASNRNASF
jgi:hypothetical protein